MRFKARAAMVFQFFTRCASSTITTSGAQAAIRSRSGLSFLVIRDLAEIVQTIVVLALRPATIDDPRRVLALPAGETQKLALPLVFERGRADHRHPCDAEVPRQYFNGGDGLDGFAPVPYRRRSMPCPRGPRTARLRPDTDTAALS